MTVRTKMGSGSPLSGGCKPRKTTSGFVDIGGFIATGIGHGRCPGSGKWASLVGKGGLVAQRIFL